MSTQRPIALFAVAFVALCAARCRAEEPLKLKTQTITITAPKITDHIAFEMVQLPPGKITLKGKDGKQIEYDIKPIWIARTELTWDVYDVFWQRLDVASPWDRSKLNDAKSRPSKPYEPPDRGWGHDGFPAITLSFQSATLCCDWLSGNTGKKFRLPTEAEWEYACRGGGPPVKLDAKELEKVAWFDNNSKDQTHHVAKKQPNAWGLYDMLGNAAEWVIRSDKISVVAGGSWKDIANDVSSSAREPYSPAWQRRDPQEPKGRSWLSDGTHVGLRVVMEESTDKPGAPLAPKSK